MCHVSFMTSEPKEALDPDLIDKLRIQPGGYVIIGSGFEPMMNKGFDRIVRKIAALDTEIEMTTNGTLLTDENVAALLDANLRHITFSFDGIRPPTYEHIRRRSNFQKTTDAIRNFKERFSGRDTYFSINTTMMKKNLEEVPEIIAYWDDAGFDLVRFIAMVIRSNEPDLIRESLYPVRQTYVNALDNAAVELIEQSRRIAISSPSFNYSKLKERFPANFLEQYAYSDHPKTRLPSRRPRQEYQLGPGPGMSFPCKSPWTFAKILVGGDVQLCYKFTIGNLNTDSFEDIWFGDKAEEIRRTVTADRIHCETCDYFRLCLSSAVIDGEDKRSYLEGPLLDGAENIDFESGQMSVSGTSKDLPILVESIGTFNIVRLRGEYLTIPQSLGPIDLTQVDPSELPGLARSRNLHAARRAASDDFIPSS
jgi:radical SAM protein with 4Fe4S-binding SPASM domain